MRIQYSSYPPLSEENFRKIERNHIDGKPMGNDIEHLLAEITRLWAERR